MSHLFRDSLRVGTLIRTNCGRSESKTALHFKRQGEKGVGEQPHVSRKELFQKDQEKKDSYEGKLNQKLRKELSRKRMAALRSNTNYVWQHMVMTKNVNLNIKKTWYLWVSLSLRFLICKMGKIIIPLSFTWQLKG